MNHLTQAPPLPTTEMLQSQHPLSADQSAVIAEQRQEFADALDNPSAHLIGIVGQCAMNDRPAAIQAESDRMVAVHGDGLSVFHRMPPWKPRTNPTDWHGLETTDPEGAFTTIANQARRHGNVAIEMASLQHVERYGGMLAVGWVGGRNVNQFDMMAAMAAFDPKLPLGIKNGLDGDIDLPLLHIKNINAMRGVDDAPAFLIYRGGSNATDPWSWRDEYERSFEQTEGRLIVDVAHGSEMAHDPNGQFAKSAAGQIAAMESVMDLSRQGMSPAGIMIEASDMPSRTDPHMPLAIALQGLQELHRIKLADRQLVSL